MPRKTGQFVAFLASIALAAGVFASGRAQLPSTPFARQVGEFSEPGGIFDTDNLISNERSYLHVIPSLKQPGIAGGAYIGVGPDQNFSYIAAARPSVAYIIDIRRDNMLLHLLFKALFNTSPTRADYLSRLFGRRLRPPSEQWRTASLEKIAAELESVQPRSEEVTALRKELDAQIAGFGVPLSPGDFETIDRFHRTFIEAGLPLKFRSLGRAPQNYYPTYRQLLFETDRQGRQSNFLVAEEDYQFVRDLEQKDLVIPVVGNLAGPTALATIGRALKQRGLTVSVFYASNVELYLFRDGLYQRYADTLSGLPRNSHSVLVRSIFNGPFVATLPAMAPGYASASVTQRLDDFAADHAAHRDTTYAALLGTRR